jgi:hypothetical protein
VCTVADGMMAAPRFALIHHLFYLYVTVLVFWAFTPRSDVVGYQSFEGASYRCVPPHFTLKLKAARTTQKFVSYHTTTRHHKSECRDLNLHRRETLKSCICVFDTFIGFKTPGNAQFSVHPTTTCTWRLVQYRGSYSYYVYYCLIYNCSNIRTLMYVISDSDSDPSPQASSPRHLVLCHKPLIK